MKILNKKISTYRNTLIFFLFTSLLLSEETKSRALGASFGFMSEKIPATIFEMTGYYSPNNKTEYFASLSYMVFGGGVGIGTKYYLRDKNKTSLFISGGLTASALGDVLEVYIGPHLATGISFSFIDILKLIEIDDRFHVGINLGFGQVFYDSFELSESYYPFLNTQVKVFSY